jgi:hypothetical protein
MNKLLAIASVVAMMSACSGLSIDAGGNPSGASVAAMLGYHGPVERSRGLDSALQRCGGGGLAQPLQLAHSPQPPARSSLACMARACSCVKPQRAARRASRAAAARRQAAGIRTHAL